MTFQSVTWVGDGGDRDSVVGFACAEARHHVLNPPQLLPDLGFLLLKHNSISKRQPSKKKYFSFDLHFRACRPTCVRSPRLMWACSADRSQSTSLSSRPYSFHAFSISCGNEGKAATRRGGVLHRDVLRGSKPLTRLQSRLTHVLQPVCGDTQRVVAKSQVILAF